MDITTRALGILMVTAFSQASAQIVPISIRSTLAVEGHTYVPPQYGGARDDYSITHTFFDNVSSFSDSVGGEAKADFVIVPPFVEPGTTHLYASSHASQSIAVLGTAISMNLLAGTQTSYFSPVAAPYARAQSDATVSFEVTAPIAFRFTGFFNFWGPWVFSGQGLPSGVGITLISSDGTVIFDSSDAPPNYRFEDPYPHTSLPTPFGVLRPGEYTLTAQLRAAAGMDPLNSDLGATMFTMSGAPVSDAGSTALLLALSLVALGACRSIPHLGTARHCVGEPV